MFLNLNAELILAQQFSKTMGYEKRHRRLGHTSDKDFQDTIKHVIGLEELQQTSHEKHTKCVSSMIGLLKIFQEKRSGPIVYQNKSTWIHSHPQFSSRNLEPELRQDR